MEPSPNITIDAAGSAPLPADLAASIDALIDRAISDRPDLAAQAAEIRAADDAIREARAAYRPQILLQGLRLKPPFGPPPTTASLATRANRRGRPPLPSNGAFSTEASEKMRSPKPSRRNGAPKTSCARSATRPRARSGRPTLDFVLPSANNKPLSRCWSRPTPPTPRRWMPTSTVSRTSSTWSRPNGNSRRPVSQVSQHARSFSLRPSISSL